MALLMRQSGIQMTIQAIVQAEMLTKTGMKAISTQKRTDNTKNL
jgi:hypothetical protein